MLARNHWNGTIKLRQHINVSQLLKLNFHVDDSQFHSLLARHQTNEPHALGSPKGMLLLLMLLLLLVLLPVSNTTNQAVQAANFDAFPKLMPQIDGHADTDSDFGVSMSNSNSNLSQCVSSDICKTFCSTLADSVQYWGSIPTNKWAENSDKWLTRRWRSCQLCSERVGLADCQMSYWAEKDVD